MSRGKPQQQCGLGQVEPDPHGGTGGLTLYLLSGEQGSTLEKGEAGSPKHLGCGSSSWVRGIWAGLVPALSATGCSREGFLGGGGKAQPGLCPGPPDSLWEAGNCSDTVKLRSEGLTLRGPRGISTGKARSWVPGPTQPAVCLGTCPCPSQDPQWFG